MLSSPAPNFDFNKRTFLGKPCLQMSDSIKATFHLYLYIPNIPKRLINTSETQVEVIREKSHITYCVILYNN